MMVSLFKKMWFATGKKEEFRTMKMEKVADLLNAETPKNTTKLKC